MSVFGGLRLTSDLVINKFKPIHFFISFIYYLEMIKEILRLDTFKFIKLS